MKSESVCKKCEAYKYRIAQATKKYYRFTTNGIEVKRFDGDQWQLLWLCRDKDCHYQLEHLMSETETNA